MQFQQNLKRVSSLAISYCNSSGIIKRSYSEQISNKTNPNYEVGKTKYQSLVGRDLLSFNGYTRNDIFSLLWIATELKYLKDPTLCENKRIGLIWSNPIVKASLTHAAQLLKASLYCVHQDQMSVPSNNYEMMGRLMGNASDIIFVETPSWNQKLVEEFATGSTCPVIVISTKDFSPALAYAELLTLFERYGFLRRLVIAYMGCGNNPMLNSYFMSLPIIGAHLRLLVNGTIDNAPAFEYGLKMSARNNTEIRQVENFDDLIYRAHTISTSYQQEPHKYLEVRNMREMDLDWTLIQYDAFKGFHASKDFLRLKNHTLLADVINNQAWIFQALVTAHTADYLPRLRPPRFEGVT